MKLNSDVKFVTLMIGFVFAWLNLSIMFTGIFQDLNEISRALLFAILMLISSFCLALGFTAEGEAKEG